MKYEKPENLYFSADIIKNKHFGYWEEYFPYGIMIIYSYCFYN